MQTLHVLGIDHTIASVAVRETIAFSKAEITAAIPLLLGGPAGIAEAMMLCTCNRTEVYLVSDGPLSCYPLEPLQRLRPNTQIFDCQLSRFTHSGLAAVEHLFAVASSLRSQMPGDTQISRQLAGAASIARGCGSIGPFLNRAIDRALRCSKLVRSATGLAAGGDSLGAEVLRILKRRFARPPSVVVSGSGALATEILAILSRASSDSSGAPRILLRGVWSSNSERLKVLSASVGTAALTTGEFVELIESSDALVLAGSGPHALIQPDHLAGRSTPLQILDLGIPRNLNPQLFAGSMASIRDLDSVQQSAADSRSKRVEAMTRAEAIVSREAKRFAERHNSRANTPYRADTYRTVESLIDRVRPSAPSKAVQLRVAMHRLLADFYRDNQLVRIT